MTRSAKMLAMVLVGAAATRAMAGDEPKVDQYTIEPSSEPVMTGTGSGKTFTVQGTLGQTFAHAPATGTGGGKTFSILGGFWGVVLNDSFTVTLGRNFNSVNNSWFNGGNWATGTPPFDSDTIEINASGSSKTILVDGAGAVGGELLLLKGDLTLQFVNTDLTLSGFGEPVSASLSIAAAGQTALLTLENIGAIPHGILGQSVHIGVPAGSDGTLILTEPGTLLSHTGEAVIGGTGTGFLNIKNGARMDSLFNGLPGIEPRVVIGEFAAGDGTVEIFNADSIWNVDTDDLIVGAAGSGSLLVKAEGIFNATLTGGLTIGDEAGSTGVFDVTNSAIGFVEDAAFVTVGRAGDGEMNVHSGGVLITVLPTTSSAITLGAEAGSSGAVTISGSGSLWSAVSQDFIVGGDGSADLFIDGGALATTTSQSGKLNIGGDSGPATVVIRNGTWIEGTAGKQVSIGAQATASVSLEGTGALNISKDLGGGFFFYGTAVVGAKGEIRGDGQVVAKLTNRGMVRPGVQSDGLGGAGMLTVTRDYSQRKASTSEADDSGDLHIRFTDDTQHDVLNVGRNVDLGGGLLVTSLTGTIAPGAYGIIEYGQVLTSTQFDAAVLLNAPDLVMTVNYAGGGGVAAGGVVEVEFTPVGDSATFDDPATLPTDGEPSAAALGGLDDESAIDLALTIPPAVAGGDGVVAVYFNLEVNGDVLTASNGENPLVLDGGTNPQAIALGDVTGDGVNDIVVADASASGEIIIEEGDGMGGFARFEPQTDLSLDTPMAVALAELSGDGLLDMAVAVAGTDSLKIFLAQDAGVGIFIIKTIAFQLGSVPCSVEPIDVDGDGLIDLAVGAAGASKVFIVKNLGGGNFVIDEERSVGEMPMSLIARNLNGGPDQGLSEIITANSVGGSVSVLRNSSTQGNIVFEPAVSFPIGESVGAQSLAAIDQDEDGDLDLAVVRFSNGAPAVQIVRNDSTTDQIVLAPAQVLPSSGDPILVLDGLITEDPDADLLTVNGGGGGGGVAGGESSVSVLPNLVDSPTIPGDLNRDKVVNGADLGLLLASWGPCGGCSADLNGDGDVNGADLGLLLAGWTG